MNIFIFVLLSCGLLLPYFPTVQYSVEAAASCQTEKVILEKPIGAGNIAVVFKAQLNEETIALKVIHKTHRNRQRSDLQIKNIIGEIHALEQIKKSESPYVLKYYGAYVNHNNLFLAIECCKMDLQTLLKCCILTINHVKYIAHDVLHGLKYLHSINIIHRDVSAVNIVISENGILKLTDFGLCHLLSSSKKPTDACGNIDYMAFEITQNEPYDEKVDIWSLGVTTYFAFVRDYPHATKRLLNGPTTKEVLAGALKGSNVDYTPITHVDIKLAKFIERCLCFDPSKRPSAEECLSDEWLSNINEKDMEDIKTWLIKLRSTPDPELKIQGAHIQLPVVDYLSKNFDAILAAAGCTLNPVEILFRE